MARHVARKPSAPTAAADAGALYEHLGKCDDIVRALKAWEPAQVELGNAVVDRAAALGNRSQFANTWTPGDPELLPGLYGPGR
ncbi:hypothetical protein ACTWP6_18210 [Mycobacterium sp. 4D054]|uniref:hypothetical protein n=1 Tax=unclassified Mycobacterium TaxID=2642494 RepID=UPI0021B3C9A5|nr:hypothetical protein [Mycobacterium sp. SMC-8]UXA13466.1 hypothetical protein KXD97_06540 [Mycobacterium sp. SMC-8]